MSHRVQRVEKEVQQIVAGFLSREFGGAKDFLITVSRVQIAGDLRSGSVYFTYFSTDEEITQQDVTEELQDLAGEIQQEIARSIRMKYYPKLTFRYDDSQEKVLKVEGLIREVERNVGPKNAAEKGDSEH